MAMTHSIDPAPCPLAWCSREGPHPVHNRLLYETRGWHDQIIAVCINQVLDGAPTLRLYLHERDSFTVAASESFTRDQIAYLAKVLGALEPMKTIELVGSLGAAVSLLDDPGRVGEEVPAR